MKPESYIAKRTRETLAKKAAKTLTVDDHIQGYEKAAAAQYGTSSTDHCSPITDHSIDILSPESLLPGTPTTALSPLQASALAAVDTAKGNLAHWAGQVKLYSRASIAAMAMAGLTLRALREIHFGPRNPNGGRPRKRDNTSGMESWTSMLADVAGITEATAKRWMLIADAVEAKASAEGGDVISICQKLPWEWTPEESQQIGNTVQSICQDKTQRDLLQQSDFLADLGYESPEKPNSSNNPFGKNGSDKPAKYKPSHELAKERQEAARLLLFGTNKPGRASPGGIAFTLMHHVKNSGMDLECIPAAELKHFYDYTLKPFADVIRKLANL